MSTNVKQTHQAPISANFEEFTILTLETADKCLRKE